MVKRILKNDFKKTFGNTVEGGAGALVISGFYSRKPVICFEQAGLLTLSFRFDTFPWFTVVIETIPPGLGRQWKLQQRVLFRDFTGFPFNSGPGRLCGQGVLEYLFGGKGREFYFRFFGLSQNTLRNLKQSGSRAGVPDEVAGFAVREYS